ncbi:MAG: carboxypeptidase-like regulatory domain-containing protein [Deltaproteobacteria bacterium]
MKHLPLTRLLFWLLVAICPPLLGHCGGAVEHGTETGNPPIVEQQKLHIVLRGTGIEVVGDAGAVSPGAYVSVTNRTTGQSAESTGRADGSVSVIVPGSLQDEYEVTVSNGSGSQTVRVAAETSGAAGSSGTELANASCDALGQTLSQSVTAAYTEASKACQADSDCTTGGDVGCYYGCGGPIVSVSGKAAAEAAIVQDTAPLCAELSRRCGPRGPPGCPYQTPTTMGCENGSCQVLSCNDLESRATARVNDTLQRAPRDCGVDADCSLIFSVGRCVFDCGRAIYSVTASIVSQLNQGVLLAQDRLCTEFESRGCASPIPLPCGPGESPTTPHAICVSRQCDVQYVPLL